MKKRILPIAAAAAVYLTLSILCYAQLGSFNLLRAGVGLCRVLVQEETVVQIADYPHRVCLVSGGDAFEAFEAYLNAEGYELLVCEQMGSQFPVERDGVREYVYWSANGFFQKWVWGSDQWVPERDDTATAPPVKPILYLYPEEVTDVTVKVNYDGELTCVYPAYHDGWHVTAHPDGTLYDKNGQEYYCLYWEGSERSWPMEEGFCVPGADTAAFLEDALAKLGLSRREANEFIVYWLPLMEDNAYNLITFQTDAYTDSAELSISPAPDTLIRVFMTFKPLDAPVDIPPQELTAPERVGFTVVEWGGGQVK